MTEMSEPHGSRGGKLERKSPRSLPRFALARRVHGDGSLVLTSSLLLIASLILIAGCILPPSLSTGDQDAGVNSPPSITAVRTEATDLFEPGPIAMIRNRGTLSFELLDTDVEDPLVVRVFIDYTIEDETPHRTQCTAPMTGTPRRNVTCSASPICQTGDIGKRRNMSIVVFDREPLESGAPEYQAMPPGGLSTSRFFFADCAEQP
jgi:hypothetical protein